MVKHIMVTATTLVAIAAAAPAFAQAMPFQQSARCVILDGDSQCGGTIKVPSGQVLTVNTISAFIANGTTTSFTLDAVYAGRDFTIGLPSIVADGSPYPGFSVSGTYLLSEGDKTLYLATRSGTSGNETTGMTLTGTLTPRPGR